LRFLAASIFASGDLKEKLTYRSSKSYASGSGAARFSKTNAAGQHAGHVLGSSHNKQAGIIVRLFFLLRFFQRTASRMQAPNSG
jgi:hypothetical protein